MLGLKLGLIETLGETDGLIEGDFDGLKLGEIDGLTLTDGLTDGEKEGLNDGDIEGEIDGDILVIVTRSVPTLTQSI